MILIFTGERNIFCLTEIGKLRWMKKLEYEPSCFLPYCSGIVLLANLQTCVLSFRVLKVLNILVFTFSCRKHNKLPDWNSYHQFSYGVSRHHLKVGSQARFYTSPSETGYFSVSIDTCIFRCMNKKSMQ